MTVQAAPQSGSVPYDDFDDDRGFGWVAFAGVVLLLVGTMNIIEGIAAIGNAHFFVANARYGY